MNVMFFQQVPQMAAPFGSCATSRSRSDDDIVFDGVRYVAARRSKSDVYD